ncbi:MAG: hypothetical protein DRJ56_08675 [Thermoprotei archaeon]|nr:MAG: hypothetical protein DRJ56_08675 [Thermoprotei archaeon]
MVRQEAGGLKAGNAMKPWDHPWWKKVAEEHARVEKALALAEGLQILASLSEGQSLFSGRDGRMSVISGVPKGEETSGECVTGVPPGLRFPGGRPWPFSLLSCLVGLGFRPCVAVGKVLVEIDPECVVFKYAPGCRTIPVLPKLVKTPLDAPVLEPAWLLTFACVDEERRATLGILNVEIKWEGKRNPHQAASAEISFRGHADLWRKAAWAIKGWAAAMRNRRGEETAWASFRGPEPYIPPEEAIKFYSSIKPVRVGPPKEVADAYKKLYAPVRAVLRMARKIPGGQAFWPNGAVSPLPEGYPISIRRGDREMIELVSALKKHGFVPFIPLEDERGVKAAVIPWETVTMCFRTGVGPPAKMGRAIYWPFITVSSLLRPVGFLKAQEGVVHVFLRPLDAGVFVGQATDEGLRMLAEALGQSVPDCYIVLPAALVDKLVNA